MQRRTFLKLGAGAAVAAGLAACGGAHDGNADLEPDPQLAAVRVEVDRNGAASGSSAPQPGGGNR